MTTKLEDRMKTPPIVSAEEWRAAREQLLVKEKEVARARDGLAAERRRMPWLAVDKADRVFRTYFINNRGDEQMGGTWNYLDITALGRQETWEDSPEGYPQTPPYQWWNYHDVHDAAK
jgi:predicted dithiol-disulfide oxidoreductase (DUF899 family)